MSCMRGKGELPGVYDDTRWVYGLISWYMTFAWRVCGSYGGICWYMMDVWENMGSFIGVYAVVCEYMGIWGVWGV